MNLTEKEQEQDLNNYINANYIPGFEGQEFIAAQGPKERTVADFWKMIWQQDVYRVAMLTNLVESSKAKCHQYWPKTKEKELAVGRFKIKMVTEESYADFVIRNLEVEGPAKDDPDSRTKKTIRQFHFTR
jgi:protein tyrosine phosphatase